MGVHEWPAWHEHKGIWGGYMSAEGQVGEIYHSNVQSSLSAVPLTFLGN